MRITVVLGRESYAEDDSYIKMMAALRASGHDVRECRALQAEDDASVVLSVGGDGTFLGVARAAAPRGIPVAGVNLGHLGFLSENTAEALVDAFESGRYHVQDRTMLAAKCNGTDYLALNEICVSRKDSSMLGIRVNIDGNELPVYWADGLLVSTPSGSTAYSLSVGGPIVMPSSRVLTIAPVAPHNLNVRPLVVPMESRISLRFISGSPTVRFSSDNISETVPSDSVVDVSVAQFSLKRLCLDNSNFIKALSEKLFWGKDKRNDNDR